MADLTERRRPREEPHLRTIQEQTLDALLRIEELLSNPLFVIKTDAPATHVAAADEIRYNTEPGGVTKVSPKRFGRK